jgi:hypothetical protein
VAEKSPHFMAAGKGKRKRKEEQRAGYKYLET